MQLCLGYFHHRIFMMWSEFLWMHKWMKICQKTVFLVENLSIKQIIRQIIWVIWHSLCCSSPCTTYSRRLNQWICLTISLWLQHNEITMIFGENMIFSSRILLSNWSIYCLGWFIYPLCCIISQIKSFMHHKYKQKPQH